MARVFIDDAILTQIAEAIRARTGNTELIYPVDMPGEITDGIPLDSTQTFMLVDEAGNEIMAVLTDEEIPLTATANDIRLGTTAVTDKGVTPGEKIIPSYHTNEGMVVIPNGGRYVITGLKHLDTYDYTKLQAVFCDFNTNTANSVSVNKVAIENNVYATESTTSLSEIIRDSINKTVDFGITNDTGKLQILRFFTYKEID